MNASLILVVSVVVYLLFYFFVIRKYKIYTLPITKIIIISVSGIAIGYLVSELQIMYTSHLLGLLILFAVGLVYYSVKLVRESK